MKKLYGALTLIALLLALSFGCSDPLKPADGEARVGEGGGDDGGSGGPEAPGGMPLSKLDTSKNGSYGKADGTPGMRVFALSKGDIDYTAVTGPDTLGLWPDNKYHIMGMPTGGYMNAGFDDALFLYYDKPFAKDETFRFSARVRITSVGGVSTGKGVHVGAYSPSYFPYSDEGGSSPGSGLAPLIDETGESQVFNTGGANGSKGVGLFMRAEATPQFRLYYSSFPDGSTTAGNTQPYRLDTFTTPPAIPTSVTTRLMDLKVGKEYIYEITRAVLPVIHDDDINETNLSARRIVQKMAYGFRLLDSKTYMPVSFHPDPRIGSLNASGGWNTSTSHPASYELGAGKGFLVTVPVDSTFHPFGTSVRIHPALREQNVFAGVCIPGSNVEVSEIKVWHDGTATWNYRDTQQADGTWRGIGTEPDFKTEYTTPAYVPANTINSIEVYGYNTFNRPSGGGYANVVYADADNWNSLATEQIQNLGPPTWADIIISPAYAQRITPVIVPDFADDNIRFQIFRMDDDGDPNFPITMEGKEQYLALRNPDYEFTDFFDPDNPAHQVYEYFFMNVDETRIASGATVTARYKIIARDLNLDVPGEDGKDAPDYSQKQSLPEFYFNLSITRP